MLIHELDHAETSYAYGYKVDRHEKKKNIRNILLRKKNYYIMQLISFNL